MNLRYHIPSYVTIANNKVLVSYDGQPLTCYGCNNTVHQFQECPTRKQTVPRIMKPTPTWTEIVQHGNTTTHAEERNKRSMQILGYKEPEHEQDTQITPNKGMSNGAQEKEETNKIKWKTRREEATATLGIVTGRPVGEDDNGNNKTAAKEGREEEDKEKSNR
jgi:hypothetical protein